MTAGLDGAVLAIVALRLERAFLNVPPRPPSSPPPADSFDEPHDFVTPLVCLLLTLATMAPVLTQSSSVRVGVCLSWPLPSSTSFYSVLLTKIFNSNKY